MSNNLIFISIVALTLFNISTYVFVMIRFTDTQKLIEELSSKQFDAEQVMKLYQQKYNRPIVTQERADIKELTYQYRLPYDVYKRMGNIEEIHQKLLEQISKQYADMIIPYIDIAIESDYFRNEEVIHSRLRVIDKRS